MEDMMSKIHWDIELGFEIKNPITKECLDNMEKYVKEGDLLKWDLEHEIFDELCKQDVYEGYMTTEQWRTVRRRYL